MEFICRLTGRRCQIYILVPLHNRCMYISKKTIRGKKYTYAEQSVRMLDGKKVNISRRIPQGSTQADLQKYADYFTDKECELAAKWALENYEYSYPLGRQDVEKIERMRILYRHVIARVKGRDRDDLWNRFVANFTFDTNAIEGSSLTLKDVTMLIFEREVPEGKSLREIYETRNSRESLDSILERRYHVREKDIIELHAAMMRDIDDRIGYKRLPNFIIGRTLSTAPPERVEEEMGELMGFYEQNRGKRHPIQLISEFHGRFERIHPFADGNGRVGRFLILIQLLDQSYPPLIVRKSQRRSYFGALEAFDNGNEAKLVRYLTEAYKRTFREFFEAYAMYL